MPRPLVQGGATKANKRTHRAFCTPSSLPPQPCSVALPTGADWRHHFTALACVSPSAVPGPDVGIHWLIFRDSDSRLLQIRALSAFELQVAPFPEPWGNA